MSNEDSVRRALDYEIEPWTPDPAVLIRGGRRIAMVRRAAAATAALAVAGTVGGVAMVVGGTSSSQPPVVATTPTPLPSTPPTVTTPAKPKPTTDLRCVAYRRELALRQRNPKLVTKPTPGPTSVCTFAVKPGTAADARRCALVYARPGTEVAIRERLAKQGLVCIKSYVIGRPKPTATIPTSVPAGL